MTNRKPVTNTDSSALQARPAGDGAHLIVTCLPGARREHGGGPYLVVMIGVAGSGKSTLARDTWDDSELLSLDTLRGLVSGDPCNQAATGQAVMILHQLVGARLRRGLTTVVDATNVHAHAREPLLQLAGSYSVPAVALIVATPVAVCLARNHARPGPAPGSRWGRRVPDAVVRDQHAQLQTCLPSLTGEGFAQVITYDGMAARIRS